ncbi:MAG: protease SohB [Endozoicomonadaceae bacterium]|nr:protease SohB [Endozoicomonadaceae bacterium]
MEFFAELGLFLAKAVILVGSILLIIGAIISLGKREGRDDRGHLDICHLNEEIKGMKMALEDAVLDKQELKKQHKAFKKEEKARKKQATDVPEKRLYVLDFHGDIRASAVSQFRQEITAVLSLARQEDEVLVRLESPGGMVHAYGLASSQLQRIKKQQISLTVAVDKVAASGGYMMACLADRLIAAPFAIIGSIGVMAQFPNIHRLLKKHHVDVELHTAGEFKRTLTLMGENTEKGRAKFIQDLEDVHVLFKEYIVEQRPVVNIEEAATGEVWHGKRALERELIDELKTSDEYICERVDEGVQAYMVAWRQKKSLLDKLGFSVQQGLDKTALTWWDRLTASRFFS